MTEDSKAREAELERIPFRKPDPKSWPPGVRTIGIGEADALGIDANGELYWHGKPIEIRRPLVLSIWQKLAAFFVAASTVSMAATDLLRFFGYGQP